MKWKRPVIVWTSHNPKAAPSKKQAAGLEEQAATIEAVPQPLLPVENTLSKPIGKSKNQKSKLQLVVIATVSAIVLGIIFGAVMLKVLTAFDNSEDAMHTSAQATGKSVLMHAYVLQGGVFTEKHNAEKWSKRYQQKGLPALVWKQDNNYYLFAGIAHSEAEAIERAKAIKAKDLDVYVKEWTAPIAKGPFKPGEKSWLDKFQRTWSLSLQGTVNGKAISKKEWVILQEQVPKGTMSEKLATGISKNLQQLSSPKERNVQQALLSVWKEAM